jgi:hypothetical protein
MLIAQEADMRKVVYGFVSAVFLAMFLMSAGCGGKKPVEPEDDVMVESAPMTELEEPVPPVTYTPDTCPYKSSCPGCTKLSLAESDRDKYKAQLDTCVNKKQKTRVVYSDDCPRPRVVKEECEEPEPCPACPETKAADAGTGGGNLIGTLMFEPPEGIRQGQVDYEITAKYVPSKLGQRGGALADYQILIDIIDTSPEGVEVFSPMAGFEPLNTGDGVWSLPVNLPGDISGPVTVKVEATLWDSISGAEQKLPVYSITIPNLSGCPECEKAAPQKAAQEKKSSGTFFAVIMLIIGLIVGGAVGSFMSGRKKS